MNDQHANLIIDSMFNKSSDGSRKEDIFVDNPESKHLLSLILKNMVSYLINNLPLEWDNIWKSHISSKSD